MRWQPSPEQIALAIDCAVARVPFERAAALLGIEPRTLQAFLKRIEATRAQKVIISSGAGGSLTAKSSRPAQSGISAPAGHPGGSPA